VAHSPVAVVEVAHTAADRVDRQTVAGRLGQHERQGQHKSAAIEDRGMIAYTKEVVVKRPVVYVSKMILNLFETTYHAILSLGRYCLCWCLC
jgi:hypothetical protein